MSAHRSPFNTRVAFVVETARRLHQYGTAAPRLEMAVSRVGERLGLRIEVWSSPTAIILSASTLDATNTAALAEVTQVMRLPPGDVDLARLCRVDRIADEVIAGTLDVEDGFRQLRALTEPRPRWWWPLSVAAFGIAAAMVAVLLHGAWVDQLAAGVIGIVI
ncbi:threonine/serine exporter family protein, partial [Metallibacterium scheffleri]